VRDAAHGPGILARVLDRPRMIPLAWAGVCAALFAVLAWMVHLDRAPLSGFDDLGRHAEHWARQSDALVRVLRWIEASADGNGYLPEQVAADVQSPHMLDYWRHRWGATATPLLWSHAMYIILSDELGLLPPA